jgi:hypothetical protein
MEIVFCAVGTEFQMLHCLYHLGNRLVYINNVVFVGWSVTQLSSEVRLHVSHCRIFNEKSDFKVCFPSIAYGFPLSVLLHHLQYYPSLYYIYQ